MALFKYVLIALVVGACIYKLVAGTSVQRGHSYQVQEHSASSELASSILHLATSPSLPPEEPSVDLLASTFPSDTDTYAASRLRPALETEPTNAQVFSHTIPTQVPNRNFGRQFFSDSGIFGPQFQFSFPHNLFPVPSYNRPSQHVAPAVASSGDNKAKFNQSGGVQPLLSSASMPVRPTLQLPKPSLTLLSPIADNSPTVHITPKPPRGSHKPTSSNSESGNHIPHTHSQHHHKPTIRPHIIYSQAQKPHGQIGHHTHNVPQKPQHEVAPLVNQESSHGPHTAGDDVIHLHHHSHNDVIVRPLLSGGHVNNVHQKHQVYVVDFPGYGSFMVLGGPHSSAVQLTHTAVGYATLYSRVDRVEAIVARHCGPLCYATKALATPEPEHNLK